MANQLRPYEPLTSENATLILVDHQVGLMTGVRDYSTEELKHNVVALAKAAKMLKLPIVVNTTARDSMWGPTFLELVEALLGVEIIDRSSVKAFDDARRLSRHRGRPQETDLRRHFARNLHSASGIRSKEEKQQPCPTASRPCGPAIFTTFLVRTTRRVGALRLARSPPKIKCSTIPREAFRGRDEIDRIAGVIKAC